VEGFAGAAVQAALVEDDRDLAAGVMVEELVDGGDDLGRGPARLGAGLGPFPGGKIEPGESPEEAAVRETLEETGL
jgi:8-oxo-dGTP diphosphatase